MKHGFRILSKVIPRDCIHDRSYKNVQERFKIFGVNCMNVTIFFSKRKKTKQPNKLGPANARLEFLSHF